MSKIYKYGEPKIHTSEDSEVDEKVKTTSNHSEIFKPFHFPPSPTTNILKFLRPRDQSSALSSASPKSSKKKFLPNIFQQGSHRKLSNASDDSSHHVSDDCHRGSIDEIESLNTKIVIFWLIGVFLWISSIVACTTRIFLASTSISDGFNSLLTSTSFFVAASIQAFVVLILITFTIHRLLGFLVGTIIRYYLNDNSGKYDIHVEWLSLRLIDKNELILSNIYWKNPPNYQSPFLLHVREASVTFDLNIYTIIRDKNILKFNEIVLDGIEIYFEKPSDDVLVKDNLAMNVWSAIGITDKESEAGTIHAIIREIGSKILHKIKPHFHSDDFNMALAYKDVDNSDDDDNVDDDNTSTSCDTAKSTELRLDFGRVVVFDVLVHALDLLSATHMEPTKATDIKIKLFHLRSVRPIVVPIIGLHR